MEKNQKDLWFVKPTWGLFLGFFAFPILAIYIAYKSDWPFWYKLLVIIAVISGLAILISSF